MLISFLISDVINQMNDIIFSKIYSSQIYEVIKSSL